MSPNKPLWFSLSKEEKRKKIIELRREGKSYAKIAEILLNDPKKKSTVFQWAKRNIDATLLKTDRETRAEHLPTDPLYDAIPRELSPEEQRIMYDILLSLYGKLNAIGIQVIEEVEKVLNTQLESLKKTGFVLDTLEERIISAIKKNIATISPQHSSPLPPVAPAQRPPTPPRPPTRTPQIPPIPSQKPLLSQKSGTPTLEEIENMTLDEIRKLPPDFLESLSLEERKKFMAIVEEKKKIANMSPEEREEYLRKKAEEKEKAQAADQLIFSLKENPMFKKLKEKADAHQLVGRGEFGKI